MNLNNVLRVALPALLAVLAPVAAADAGADQKRAEQIVAERCSLCHGKGGESASAVFPRLAGQHPEYVARQLADFKSGKRSSETMRPQAESLTPEEMAALGAYFGARKAGGRRAQDVDLLAVGKYIFEHGNRYAGRVMAPGPTGRRSSRAWPASIRAMSRISSGSSASASGPMTMP